MSDPKPATDEQVRYRYAARDDEIVSYRRGVEKGTLRSATPSVVRSLIDRIEADAQALATADELLGEALPHVAAHCSVEVGWQLYENFDPPTDEADALFARIESWRNKRPSIPTETRK